LLPAVRQEDEAFMTTAAFALLLAAPAARPTPLDLRIRDRIAGSAYEIAGPAPSTSVESPPPTSGLLTVASWIAAFGSMAAAQALGARDETFESRATKHSIQESAATNADARSY
jgi:hypothetical protein